MPPITPPVLSLKRRQNSERNQDREVSAGGDADRQNATSTATLTPCAAKSPRPIASMPMAIAAIRATRTSCLACPCLTQLIVEVVRDCPRGR